MIALTIEQLKQERLEEQKRVQEILVSQQKLKAENEQLQKDLQQVNKQMNELKLQQSQKNASQASLSQGKLDDSVQSQAVPILKPILSTENNEFKSAKSHISKSVASKSPKKEIIAPIQVEIISVANDSNANQSKPKSAKLEDAINQAQVVASQPSTVSFAPIVFKVPVSTDQPKTSAFPVFKPVTEEKKEEKKSDIVSQQASQPQSNGNVTASPKKPVSFVPAATTSNPFLAVSANAEN